MRFLSVALLSGCALVDASGDPSGLGVPAELTFEQAAIDGSAGATEVSIGDFDLNTTDIDVAFLVGGTVTTSRNMGAGQFAEAQPSPAIGYSLLVARDLNGDGRAELIVAGQNKLDIYTSNGTGFDLTPLSTKTLAQTPTHLTTGRFPALEDGSNVAAIIVAYATINMVRVVANVFGTATTDDVTLANEVFDVTAANVSGVEGDEILVAFPGTAAIRVFSNPGPSSTFADFTTSQNSSVSMLAAGELASSVVETDVLYAEIVPTGPSSLRLATGSAAGLTTSLVQFDVGFTPFDIATGDMDGEGQDDFVSLVQTAGGRELHVFLRGPGATFTDPVVIGVDSTASRIVIGNLDDDARADVLVYPNSANGIDVLLSR